MEVWVCTQILFVVGDVFLFKKKYSYFRLGFNKTLFNAIDFCNLNQIQGTNLIYCLNAQVFKKYTVLAECIRWVYYQDQFFANILPCKSSLVSSQQCRVSKDYHIVRCKNCHIEGIFQFDYYILFLGNYFLLKIKKKKH